MARFSRTVQEVLTPRRRSGSKEIPAYRFEDPTFLPRLAWRLGPSVPTDEAFLADAIRRSDGAHFCDTSLIDDHLDPRVVEALLAAPGRLVTTPQVNQELRPWLSTRPDHPLLSALRSKDPAWIERAPPPEGAAGRSAYDYYVSLLDVRRRLTEIARTNFVMFRGREPVDEEELTAFVQRTFGSRGLLLAKKPGSSLRTDEALVYLAVEYALSTGRETKILTRDADVFEQFYKLIWLIDTHYRGYLLARHYLANFAAFRPRPFRKELTEDVRWPFGIDGSTMIDLPGDSGLTWLLPESFRFVAISCGLIGRTRSSWAAFGGERGLKAVLDAKDLTGGLSTSILGGRNVHPWLAPLPLKPEERRKGAVVRDIRLPLPGTDVAIPLLDLQHALSNQENHTELVPHDRSTPATLAPSAGRTT